MPLLQAAETADAAFEKARSVRASSTSYIATKKKEIERERREYFTCLDRVGSFFAESVQMLGDLSDEQLEAKMKELLKEPDMERVFSSLPVPGTELSKELVFETRLKGVEHLAATSLLKPTTSPTTASVAAAVDTILKELPKVLSSVRTAHTSRSASHILPPGRQSAREAYFHSRTSHARACVAVVLCRADRSFCRRVPSIASSSSASRFARTR
jgi:hypothetical protein